MEELWTKNRKKLERLFNEFKQCNAHPTSPLKIWNVEYHYYFVKFETDGYTEFSSGKKKDKKNLTPQQCIRFPKSWNFIRANNNGVDGPDYYRYFEKCKVTKKPILGSDSLGWSNIFIIELNE